LTASDFEKVREVAEALRMVSPYQWKPLESPFSFLASSSLSGAGNPSFGIESRLRRVRRLARFAALYADTVLIPDPFEGILHGETSKRDLMDFFHTLAVLQALQSEIEAGIVRFAPTDFPLCQDGLEKFRRVEDAYWSRLSAISDPLTRDIIEDLDIDKLSKDNYSYISIGDAEQYVPQRQIDFLPGPDGWSSGSAMNIPDQDIIRTVQEEIVDPALSDLQFRNILNWLYDVRYLTDRPIDADVLYLINDADGVQAPRLDHTLPFIDGLNTETLVKLREEEGEAFQVYRNRVQQLVEEGPLSGEEFREAFRELVEPQLDKIDKAVDTANKMASREIREKIVIGSGVVTFGLAAGTISPEAGAVVSALGGAKFGADLLSSISTLLSEPEAAMENDFFYLWKARELYE